MTGFFKGLFLLVFALSALQTRAAEPEQETIVQGVGRNPSESLSRAEALDQCHKNLVLAKNACTDKKGSFREVLCGVSCTDLTAFWECRASGSAFCHGHQEPL